MKTLTYTELENKDSFAIASIIDYWKKYDRESVIQAFLTLVARNENLILKNRIKKFKEFANSQGTDAQSLIDNYIISKSLHEYLGKIPQEKIYNLLNPKTFDYEFKKLGNLTNTLGYLVGFLFVVSLLTITAGVGVIIGIIIYKFGFRLSKMGFLIYDKYKSFVRNEIDFVEFKKALQKSFIVTILLTVFFALLSLFLIGHLDFNDSYNYFSALLIITLFAFPLIPNYILLVKLRKTYLN